MNLLKNLIINKNCPICLKKKFKNLGNVNIGHPDLKSLLFLLECAYCDHWFYSMTPNEKYLKYMYNSNSKYIFGHVHSKYELDITKKIKKSGLKLVTIDEKHWVFRHMKKFKVGNYLEIGPGFCSLFKTFRNHGWKCEGYELQSWIKDKGIVDKPSKIKKNKKDVLVMHDVLEHVRDPVNFLKKFSKLQKKSGKVFLAYPNSDSFKAKILKTNWPMVEPLGHLNFFSFKSTKIMLEKCGYKPLVIKTASFVIGRKLLRSILRLPFTLILDLLKMNFISALKRFPEIFLNILDLINANQFHIVAIKK